MKQATARTPPTPMAATQLADAEDCGLLSGGWDFFTPRDTFDARADHGLPIRSGTMRIAQGRVQAARRLAV